MEYKIYQMPAGATIRRPRKRMDGQKMKLTTYQKDQRNDALSASREIAGIIESAHTEESQYGSCWDAINAIIAEISRRADPITRDEICIAVNFYGVRLEDAERMTHSGFVAMEDQFAEECKFDAEWDHLVMDCGEDR